MPEMTIADCAEPLWDAGCRVKWEVDRYRYRLWLDAPDGFAVQIKTANWLSCGSRTTHEAAVLLLWQALSELEEHFNAGLCIACEQGIWHVTWLDPLSGVWETLVNNQSSKHAAIVAAYLAMKGVEG